MPAVGVLVSSGYTNGRGFPVLTITYEVHMEGRPPFQAKARTKVYDTLVPGSRAALRFCPDAPNEVALV